MVSTRQSRNRKGQNDRVTTKVPESSKQPLDPGHASLQLKKGTTVDVVARSSEFLEVENHLKEDTDNPRSAKRSGNDLKNQNSRNHVRDNFAWLVRTGRLITIDPLDTIPLTCVREISDSGVAKLEYAFLRSENGPGMSMGVSSAAPQPFVVEIPKNRLHYVVDYFTSVKGLSVENAHAISRSKVWYGIVEGAHRRKALINLGEKVPSTFKGYPWLVICIDWQPIEVLRAFARERNEFQRGEHIIDFTVYDIFKNLKQSDEEVALREGLTEGKATNKGYLKRVADQYCGGKDSANSLTRQLAGISVVLSWPVVEEMGVILNKEDLDRARAAARAAGDGSDEYIDARVCKDYFTKSTFRGATTFKTLACEDDQISTLRRLYFLAQQRSYKPIAKNELESQTKKVIAARQEVEKMGKKLGSHPWPSDMKDVRESLLNTNLLDSEVEEYANGDEIIPSFMNLWETLFPIAAELENASKNGVGSSPRDKSGLSKDSNLNGTEDFASACGENSPKQGPENKDQEEFIAESEAETDIFNDHTQHDSTSVQDCVDENGDRSDDDKEEENDLCPLKQMFLRAENKAWRDFQLDLESEDLFDFIFSDPVQSLSSDELKQNIWTEFKDERNVKEFAHFCRISLRPGCYVFVIVLPEESSAFSSAFQAEGMKVMKAPFFIIPNADSLRATRLKGLPQGCGELAVVARAPGTHASFSANFEQPYSLVECTFTRKMGIIDNVPRCQNPLHGKKSKAEIRPRERHPDFVSEIIETFCSPTGTVLDIFGGALTTGISCISSRRACVVLEKDKFCFDLGIRRLEKLCRDKLLNPDEPRLLAGEEDLVEHGTFE